MDQEAFNFIVGLILFIAVGYFFAHSGAQAGRAGFNYAGNQSYTEPKNLPSDKAGIGNELGKIEVDLKRVQKEIDDSRSKAEESAFKGEIFLEGAGNAWATSPSQEYISLSVNSSVEGKTLITGWEIRSPITGRSVTIGKGVYFPFLGNINSEELIFVSPGDHVVISTGRSPLGVSFRLNKCTGYFEQFQDFSPPLPRQCPRPERETPPAAPNNINDRCLDYLESLASCIMPLSDIPENLSSECYSYVTEKINYATCVDQHRNDKDFYKNEWRVFLGRDEELWKQRREVIKLLDLNKKTVDAVTY